MILSDGEIRKELTAGRLSIEPPIDFESQLQPASVDLRLGRRFVMFRPSESVIRPGVTNMEDHATYRHVDPGGEFVFWPGKFVLATTEETVKIGNHMVARVEGRSSFGRLGLTVHSTAGFVDPGFHGKVTLEITNEGPYPIAVKPGWRICQLAFEWLGKPSIIPYGHPDRRSKYQGQSDVTPSRTHMDGGGDADVV